MSRVWKKVFKVLFRGLGIGLAMGAGYAAIAGVIGSILYFGFGIRNADVIMTVSTILPLLVIMVVVILKGVYDDCKRTVEKENRALMRKIH